MMSSNKDGYPKKRTAHITHRERAQANQREIQRAAQVAKDLKRSRALAHNDDLASEAIRKSEKNMMHVDIRATDIGENGVTFEQATRIGEAQLDIRKIFVSSIHDIPETLMDPDFPSLMVKRPSVFGSVIMLSTPHGENDTIGKLWRDRTNEPVLNLELIGQLPVTDPDDLPRDLIDRLYAPEPMIEADFQLAKQWRQLAASLVLKLMSTGYVHESVGLSWLVKSQEITNEAEGKAFLALFEKGGAAFVRLQVKVERVNTTEPDGTITVQCLPGNPPMDVPGDVTPEFMRELIRHQVNVAAIEERIDPVTHEVMLWELIGRAPVISVMVKQYRTFEAVPGFRMDP